MVELAAAFGQLPDTVASGMSEVWFWRSVVYLQQKNRNQRKPRDMDAADMPAPADVDEQGAWILTE